MANKIVSVTGASGFLATEIIAQLIEKGYKVRGSVRDLHNKDKVSHLKELFPTLQLYEADLLKEGSYDEMIAGSDFVMHTASPFFTTPKDAQVELIEPAVNGTKNVLKSVAKAGTVKVVVVTSSVAAILEEVHNGDPNKVWTEADWNTTSTLTKGPYRLSKTLAERTACDWAKENPSIKLVTVNPTLIIGPPRSKRVDATSIQIVKSLIDGSTKDGVPASGGGSADVRDVARTHIALIEKPNANGRYMITSSRSYARLELAQFLKAKFPNYPIADKQIGGEIPKVVKFSTKKLETELGITPGPIEKAVVEMAQALIDLGLVEKH